MENIRELQFDTPISANKKEVAENNARTSVKKKVKLNKIKFKKFLISFNIIVSLVLVCFIAMSYNDMVGISSNNSLYLEENKILELEVSNLSSIVKPFVSDERIEKIAMSRLDMIYPTNENIAVIEDGYERLVKLEDFATSKENHENNRQSVFSVISNIFR